MKQSSTNQSTLIHIITGAIIIRMFKLLDTMFYLAEFGRNISGSLERKERKY